jgi:hypothetical protein
MKIGLTTNNSVMALCAMATSSCQATTSTGTSRIAGYQTKSKVTGVSQQGFFLFRDFVSRMSLTPSVSFLFIVEQNRFGSG